MLRNRANVAWSGTLYDLKIVYGDTVKMKHVKKLRKKLYAIKQAEKVVFVHGIGKRKTPLQKSIETLEDYLSRLKKYNHQIHICGGRNSYSKISGISGYVFIFKFQMFLGIF